MSAALLYKTAAALYVATVPGHIIMGRQVVYPALAKIPKAETNDKIGERGADNCWGFVTTSLAVSALLHYQWSRTFGPQTMEEIVILVLTNGHIFGNAVRYLQVGEVKAGGAMMAASMVGTAAYLLQFYGN